MQLTINTKLITGSILEPKEQQAIIWMNNDTINQHMYKGKITGVYDLILDDNLEFMVVMLFSAPPVVPVWMLILSNTHNFNMIVKLYPYKA